MLKSSTAADDTSTGEETSGRTDREDTSQTSVDVSEYERQMLEMQARQEQMDEECILAFQVSCDVSCHCVLISHF